MLVYALEIITISRWVWRLGVFVQKRATRKWWNPMWGPRPTLPELEVHWTNGSRHAAQYFSRLDTILADTWGIL